MKTSLPKKILLISASRKKQNELNSTPLYQSVEYISDQVKLIMHPDNKSGLPDVYNNYIKPDFIKEHDIVAFIHDDVRIEDSMFGYKLYQAINQYSIVGVAGTSELTIAKPCLWHKMSPNESNWSGAVAHPYQGGVRMTHFGTSPKACIVLDGLFLAARLIDLLSARLRFDPQFYFHHYDLDFCIQAHQKGLNLTTWPIWLLHNSWGLASRNNPVFSQSEDLFLLKYSS
jgi:hypothetical protein